MTSKDGIICKFPAVAVYGYLSLAFFVASNVIACLSLLYPYKERSVPPRNLVKNECTPCNIILLL